MKRIYTLWIVFACTLVLAQSPYKNYIRSRVMLSSDGSKYLDNIQYFDSWGNPSQQVQKGVTPTKGDLVSLTEYDPLNRPVKKWIPTPFPGNNGNYVTDFKSQAPGKHENDPFPYEETVYEPLLIDEISQEIGCGQEWRNGGTPKGVSNYYFFNDDRANVYNAYHYSVSDDGTVTKSGKYPAGELYGKESTDEDGHKVYKFINRKGQVILIRQMNEGVMHDTYYLYDDYGRKRYVFPPLVSDATKGNWQYRMDDNNVMGLYAYYYEYNDRNLCTLKKLPGCKPIYQVYDQSDRLVLTQDGNQRSENLWTVYKYDILGRLLYTAEVEDSTPFAEQLARFDEMLVVEKFSTSSQSYPMGDTGYSRVYYHEAPTTLLTVNYYDNYDFLHPGLVPSATISQLEYSFKRGFGEKSAAATGLLTGTRTYSLSDPDSYTLTVFYYDEKGNIVQKRSTNHVGGYDHHYYAYSFDCVLRQYEHDHVLPNGTLVPECYGYTYDHANRPLQTGYWFLDWRIQYALSLKSYDELGRLASERINNFRYTTQYKYNIRGWLTGIDSPHFKEVLHYCSSNGSYNGNIDHLEWKVQGEDVTHNYYFQYDGLNRLTDAQYGSVTPSVGIMSNAYRVSSKYDKQGNILRLSRSGLLLPVAPKSRIIGGEESGGGSGGSSDYYYGVIDDLTLTYIGNRLHSVSDVAAVDPVYKDGMHFFDGADLSSEYAYDSNGNMVLDKNKYVTDISYNRLNLPSSISVSTPTGSLLLPLQRKEDYASYDYDACGGKLTSSYAASNNDMTMSFYSTIDYCCNYIYENGVLSKVLLPNGYISIDESNKVRYHYYLKDHQGNIRVVLSQGNAAEQVNHYYPFGALWGLSKNGSFQKYKFGGKELERVAGLDLYDFEARQYDPILGRFISMDPLCEKYYSVSPYAYCMNNPLNSIDPTGKEVYILGSLSQKAFEQFQSGARGIKLTLDSSGALCYTLNNKRLNDYARTLIGMIDDSSIIVNLHATDNNTLPDGGYMVGGAFMGNSLSNDSEGNATVSTSQIVNPNVLGAIDDFTYTSGKMIMHELSESYQGGLLSKERGISSPRSGLKGSVYKEAHRRATPQTRIKQRWFNKMNSETMLERDVVKREYYIENFKNEKKVIQTHYEE